VRRVAFFANTFRTGFTIIFTTLASYLYLRNMNPKQYPISVLGNVPSGFQHMGVPVINADIISKMAPLIPVSTILVFLEHIAISKSFGRVNNYKIDPNQELVAIGVNNLVSVFFGAYPSTGSFSRSAIKSRAGVRTPLAGWWTGGCVVIALYALAGAFKWISNAALSAVIIEAVGTLIAHPRQTYAYWLVSPLEAVIFLVAVILTVFTSIEVGIYFSIAASAALLLVRMAMPRGKLLGRVRVRQERPAGNVDVREVWVPLTAPEVENPQVHVEPAPPGVIVFRMEESFLYINAAHYTDQLVAYAHQHTRNGQDYSLTPQGDRPWNDPGPSRFQKRKAHVDLEQRKYDENAAKPPLKAVVFDFGVVSHVDTTAIQGLVDAHKVLNRYAGHEVEFHFASVLSPWIKRCVPLLLCGLPKSGSIARADSPRPPLAVLSSPVGSVATSPSLVGSRSATSSRSRTTPTRRRSSRLGRRSTAPTRRARSRRRRRTSSAPRRRSSLRASTRRSTRRARATPTRSSTPTSSTSTSTCRPPSSPRPPLRAARSRESVCAVRGCGICIGSVYTPLSSALSYFALVARAIQRVAALSRPFLACACAQRPSTGKRTCACRLHRCVSSCNERFDLAPPPRRASLPRAARPRPSSLDHASSHTAHALLCSSRAAT